VARGSIPKSGNSKVRLIVFEAEMSDGDLSQVTQAIQNALQPRQPSVRVVQSSPPKALTESVDEQLEVDDADLDEEPSAEPAKPKAPRTSKPRVAKTPTVLNEIDANSEPSLKGFGAQYDLSSTIDKYLVVALWFRDARNTPTITVDHVYTCFKLLNWSTSSNDFQKPMRNLRDEQSLKGGSKEGYFLTLPGAGKIEAKKRTA